MRRKKTGAVVEFNITGERLARLREYVARHLPLLSGTDKVDALFPGTSRGRGHKSEPSLRQAITGAILQHVGVHVHPHLFRHFAGALILMRDPGAHSLVSRLLGHTSVQITVDFYSGLETIWAAEAYHEILEDERSSGTTRLRRPRHNPRRSRR